MSQANHRKTRWTVIGSGLFCPVAVGRQPGHITLFARGATGELLYTEGDGITWSKFHSLGQPVAHIDGSDVSVPVDWPLAVCSGNPNRIDLFARSPDGELLHMTRKQSTWGAFEYIGAPALVRENIAIPMGLAGPPAACTSGPERIDVFAVGPDGDLLHSSFNGEIWSGFESLGIPTTRSAGTQQPTPLAGPLAACRCGRDRMGLFARGTRGDVILKWWDGAQWSEFASLGLPEVQYDLYPAVNAAAPLTGPPAACSWGAERIDVFARGPGGDLLHKSWGGEDWSRFESLWMPTTSDAARRAMPFTGAVAACTWGPNRLDVFARAVDGNLYHAWWDGTWDHD